MRSKCLLITPDYPPATGGVARFLSMLADYFRDEIQVVTSQPVSAGSKYVRHESLEWKLWPRWMKTVFLLIRERKEYDVVLVSHVIPFGTAAMLAGMVTKKPYVVFTHGMDVRLALKTKRELLRHVLGRARQVVANTRALASEIEQECGISSVLTVHPPVNLDFANEHFNTSKEKNVIHWVSVSRLVERKGHVRVLRAMARLNAANRLHQVHYTIVGDGPMRSALKALVMELNLSQKVTFAGSCSDEELKQYYATSDLFVLPVIENELDKEGFGMVFLEAALFGIPSVSTRMSGVDEAIIDGETGVLVADGDEEGLAQVLERLSDNHAERIRLGQAACVRARREFSPEVQFSKIKNCLYE